MTLSPRWQHLTSIERKRIANPPMTMRLGRLERPEPWEQALLDEIRATLPLDRMQQYPDYPPFYAQLAEFAGVPQDSLVVGWGIEGLVRDLYMLCCEPGDAVLLPWPTCMMFEVYARAFGLETRKIQTFPGNVPELRADDFVRALDDRIRGAPKLVLLPNPGQPVDTLIGREMWDVAASCYKRGIVLAIDEAYHGFGGPTFIDCAASGSWPNVVVLRTFSKAFGAAGIRLGYAVAGPKLRQAFDAVRPSGEAASFSMHAASVLMRRYDEIVWPGIAAVCEGRDWLREAVRAELGLPAWGEHANHVLIEFPDAECAQRTWHRLAADGIYVKAPYDPPLDRHLLVTCGGRALMERFFDRLRAAIR